MNLTVPIPVLLVHTAIKDLDLDLTWTWLFLDLKTCLETSVLHTSCYLLTIQAELLVFFNFHGSRTERGARYSSHQAYRA